MATIAIISDVHANLEDLEAALADVDSPKDISAVYCLGDLMGYVPDPVGVIDLVEAHCAWGLMGNHDYAMLHSPEGFTDIAAGAIQCQRRELAPNAEESRPDSIVDYERTRRWSFLRKMKDRVEHDYVLYVHALPSNRLFEYLSPDGQCAEYRKTDRQFRKGEAMLLRRSYSLTGNLHRRFALP
jgi:hypothetical protein